MKVERITIEQLDAVKEDLVELIRDTMAYNFPDSVISDSYYDDSIQNLRMHLAEERALVFVARDEKKICGWIWCHEISRFDSRRLHIANLAVSKDVRNSGIGRFLLEAAERHARENNLNGLDLLVTKENVNAVDFYEMNGFEVERYMMKKVF